MRQMILGAILVVVCLQALEAQRGKDTSFTLNSAALQIMKDYPFVRPVPTIIGSRVILHRDIIYTRYCGRELKLDLVSPKNLWEKKRPVIILIHGGGWRSGDRTMELPTALKLAESGFICACVEYRLSPEAKYPAALYDIKTAIRWCRSNAVQFNIDTTTIIVYGTSAGGHLAALLGTSQAAGLFNEQGDYKDHSGNVQAVIDIDGVLDFTDPAESGKDTLPDKPSAGKAFLGASYTDNPVLWKMASPINYISSKTPPFLFINSSHVRFHAGRDSVMHMMNRFGIFSEVHTIANTPHPFWLFHPWFDETIKYIQVFLQKFRK